MKKSLMVLMLTCGVLSFGFSKPSLAFDVDSCPSQLTYVFSNIARISEAKLLTETKALYSYAGNYDPGQSIRENWKSLNGIGQYIVQGKLSFKSDSAQSPSCTYLAGTEGGVWIELKGVYQGHGHFDTYLQVSTPFGMTTSRVVGVGPGGIQLAQDPSSRSITNTVRAGYEDGGYDATVEIAVAGSVSAR